MSIWDDILNRGKAAYHQLNPLDEGRTAITHWRAYQAKKKQEDDAVQADVNVIQADRDYYAKTAPETPAGIRKPAPVYDHKATEGRLRQHGSLFEKVASADLSNPNTPLLDLSNEDEPRLFTMKETNPELLQGYVDAYIKNLSEIEKTKKFSDLLSLFGAEGVPGEVAIAALNTIALFYQQGALNLNPIQQGVSLVDRLGTTAFTETSSLVSWGVALGAEKLGAEKLGEAAREAKATTDEIASRFKDTGFTRTSKLRGTAQNIASIGADVGLAAVPGLGATKLVKAGTRIGGGVTKAVAKPAVKKATLPKLVQQISEIGTKRRVAPRLLRPLDDKIDEFTKTKFGMKLSARSPAIARVAAEELYFVTKDIALDGEITWADLLVFTGGLGAIEVLLDSRKAAQRAGQAFDTSQGKGFFKKHRDNIQIDAKRMPKAAKTAFEELSKGQLPFSAEWAKLLPENANVQVLKPGHDQLELLRIQEELREQLNLFTGKTGADSVSTWKRLMKKFGVDKVITSVRRFSDSPIDDPLPSKADAKKTLNQVKQEIKKDTPFEIAKKTKDQRFLTDETLTQLKVQLASAKTIKEAQRIHDHIYHLLLRDDLLTSLAEDAVENTMLRRLWRKPKRTTEDEIADLFREAMDIDNPKGSRIDGDERWEAMEAESHYMREWLREEYMERFDILFEPRVGADPFSDNYFYGAYNPTGNAFGYSAFQRYIYGDDEGLKALGLDPDNLVTKPEYGKTRRKFYEPLAIGHKTTKVGSGKQVLPPLSKKDQAMMKRLKAYRDFRKKYHEFFTKNEAERSNAYYAALRELNDDMRQVKENIRAKRKGVKPRQIRNGAFQIHPDTPTNKRQFSAHTDTDPSWLENLPPWRSKRFKGGLDATPNLKSNKVVALFHQFDTHYPSMSGQITDREIIENIYTRQNPVTQFQSLSHHRETRLFNFTGEDYMAILFRDLTSEQREELFQRMVRTVADEHTSIDMLADGLEDIDSVFAKAVDLPMRANFTGAIDHEVLRKRIPVTEIGGDFVFWLKGAGEYVRLYGMNKFDRFKTELDRVGDISKKDQELIRKTFGEIKESAVRYMRTGDTRRRLIDTGVDHYLEPTAEGGLRATARLKEESGTLNPRSGTPDPEESAKLLDEVQQKRATEEDVRLKLDERMMRLFIKYQDKKKGIQSIEFNPVIRALKTVNEYGYAEMLRRQYQDKDVLYARTVGGEVKKSDNRGYVFGDNSRAWAKPFAFVLEKVKGRYTKLTKVLGREEQMYDILADAINSRLEVLRSDEQLTEYTRTAGDYKMQKESNVQYHQYLAELQAIKDPATLLRHILKNTEYHNAAVDIRVEHGGHSTVLGQIKLTDLEIRNGALFAKNFEFFDNSISQQWRRLAETNHIDVSIGINLNPGRGFVIDEVSMARSPGLLHLGSFGPGGTNWRRVAQDATRQLRLTDEANEASKIIDDTTINNRREFGIAEPRQSRIVKDSQREVIQLSPSDQRLSDALVNPKLRITSPQTANLTRRLTNKLLKDFEEGLMVIMAKSNIGSFSTPAQTRIRKLLETADMHGSTKKARKAWEELTMVASRLNVGLEPNISGEVLARVSANIGDANLPKEARILKNLEQLTVGRLGGKTLRSHQEGFQFQLMERRARRAIREGGLFEKKNIDQTIKDNLRVIKEQIKSAWRKGGFKLSKIPRAWRHMFTETGELSDAGKLYIEAVHREAGLAYDKYKGSLITDADGVIDIDAISNYAELSGLRREFEAYQAKIIRFMDAATPVNNPVLRGVDHLVDLHMANMLGGSPTSVKIFLGNLVNRFDAMTSIERLMHGSQTGAASAVRRTVRDINNRVRHTRENLGKDLKHRVVNIDALRSQSFHDNVSVLKDIQVALYRNAGTRWTLGLAGKGFAAVAVTIDNELTRIVRAKLKGDYVGEILRKAGYSRKEVAETVDRIHEMYMNPDTKGKLKEYHAFVDARTKEAMKKVMPDATDDDIAREMARIQTRVHDEIQEIKLASDDAFWGTTGTVADLLKKWRLASAIPFVRAGANFLSRQVELVPALGAVKVATERARLAHMGKLPGATNWREGLFSRRTQARVLDRQVKGYILMLLGFAASSHGLVTGPRPRDQAGMERFDAEGKVPYGIKIPGLGWFSFDPIKYLTPAWMVGVSLEEVMNDKVSQGNVPKEVFTWLLRSAGASLLTVEDLSLTSGFKDLTELVDPRGQDTQANVVNRVAADHVSRFINGFIKGIARILDNNRKAPTTFWEMAFWQHLPLLSKRVADKQLAGEKIENSIGGRLIGGYGVSISDPDSPVIQAILKYSDPDINTGEGLTLGNIREADITSKFSGEDWNNLTPNEQKELKADFRAVTNERVIQDLETLVHNQIDEQIRDFLQTDRWKEAKESDKGKYLRNIIQVVRSAQIKTYMIESGWGQYTQPYSGQEEDFLDGKEVFWKKGQAETPTEKRVELEHTLRDTEGGAREEIKGDIEIEKVNEVWYTDDGKATLDRYNLGSARELGYDLNHIYETQGKEASLAAFREILQYAEERYHAAPDRSVKYLRLNADGQLVPTNIPKTWKLADEFLASIGRSGSGSGTSRPTSSIGAPKIGTAVTSLQTYYKRVRR